MLFWRLQMAKDLMHPSYADERRKHKKRRLVQRPNSYFMDVKCIGNLFSKAHCHTKKNKMKIASQIANIPDWLY